jgi:DNA-3-methyladenine glycosylase
MIMKLKREFFLDSPRVVAKKLIGKELVRKVNGEVIVCKIVETEAYGA